jgi:tetratricopeptide (TPR) repeat protein
MSLCTVCSKPAAAEAGCDCALHVGCVPEPWWRCELCHRARAPQALAAISGHRFERASGFRRLLWACADAHCRRDPRAARLALRLWRRALGPTHATTVVLATAVADLCERRGKPRLAAYVRWRSSLVAELPLALDVLAERGDFAFARRLRPEEELCFLCWAGGDLVAAGCACRGAAALAHVACQEHRAAHAHALTGLDHLPWTTCSTCLQDFTGTVREALARRWCVAAAAAPLPHRLSAATNLARCLEHSGQIEEAMRLHLDTLAVCRDAQGPDHPDSLACELALGTALHTRGLFAEAHAVQERVHGRMCAAVGPDDPQSLACAQNLALSLASLGRHADAEALNRATLPRLAALHGDDHYSTLLLRSNLALCLADQAKYEEAEAISAAVHAARTRLLGPEHPETLVGAGNLAMVISLRGRHAEAEAIQRALIPQQRRVLGADHPSTLCNLVNLGSSLQSQGKFAPAERHLREALAAERRVLGAEHPSVFTTEQQLLRLLSETGRHDEAEAGIARLLATQVRVIGEAHPSTRILRALRTANDARGEPCYICLEAAPAPAPMGCACRGAAGRAHASCLVALATASPDLSAWARCRICQQRFTGSMELALVLVLRRRLAGSGRLDDRFQAEAWYAEALMHRGEFEEAERLLRALCEEQARLGSPRAFTTAVDVAAALYGQREYARAVDIYRRALARSPDDASIRGNLASALLHLGPAAVAEAEQLHRRVVDDVRARLGAEHPDTLTATNNLAHAIDYGGKHDEARAMLEAVVAVQRRVLGPDHPETLSTAGSVLLFAGSPRALAAHRDHCDRALGPAHPTSVLARDLADAAELPRGTVVILVGLSRAELNGRKGRVAGPAGPGRYAVRIRSATLALRRRNLLVAPSRVPGPLSQET